MELGWRRDGGGVEAEAEAEAAEAEVEAKVEAEVEVEAERRPTVLYHGLSRTGAGARVEAESGVRVGAARAR